jgi:predicted GH43/DUF377 family glycosyl hydrolase
MFLMAIGLTTFFYSGIFSKLFCYDKKIQALDQHGMEKNEIQGLCSSLKKIPTAEKMGIVKAVRRIQLKEIKTPYNASIVKEGDGFLLFFRYDILEKIPHQHDATRYSSNIAVARLNREFNQVAPIKKIDTGSSLSQDPRVIRLGNALFLSYNDVAKNVLHCRQMRLARIDTSDFSLGEVLDLDLNLKPVEKNWVPFAFQDQEGQEKLYFGYNFNPHKILSMEDITKNELDHLVFPSAIAYQHIPWIDTWGEIRGGTPALLVDGQYLAFFHSSFKEDKKKWYVMGAYTFEKDPPFRITAVSEFPMIFQGIYDTPAENTSSTKLRCIYPAGFVMSHERAQEEIYLSCGENDCSVKILTLDKKKLLDSLIPITLTTD